MPPRSSDPPPDRLPDPTDTGEGASTVFAGFRAPAVIVDAIRERAAQEGISVGELVTYAFTRLLQLEDTAPGANLATLPEDDLRAALRTVQHYRQSGEIAGWVQTWVGETRSRQLHPPSIDETPQA